MITASEARQKVTDLNLEKYSLQIKECEKFIQEAIENGQFSVTKEISLYLPVRQYLESLGYKVEYYSHRNESYTTISW